MLLLCVMKSEHCYFLLLFHLFFMYLNFYIILSFSLTTEVNGATC